MSINNKGRREEKKRKKAADAKKAALKRELRLQADLGLQGLDKHRSEYAANWRANALKFTEDGHYAWMAGFVDGYDHVLEIGTGDGSSTLELLRRGHRIVSIDENPACLQMAAENLRASGYEVSHLKRETRKELNKSYSISYQTIEGVPAGQCVLVEGDINNDPHLLQWLYARPAFDAVVCWLIGSHSARKSNDKILNAPVESSGDYRLYVQNAVYVLADRVLRPGGLLQIVDRGELLRNEALRLDALNSHRDQASVTSLVVAEEITQRTYEDPQGTAIQNVITVGLSGRLPDVVQLALSSILAHKPA